MRLIDADGENRGVVPLAQAQEIANQASLDLVEVAADARPPVCRIMDYGKWRYEQEQKAKQARRHQSTITIKEIKFRPKIDPHDYATKKGHVERFLRHRDKVKITIMFRGRELLHPERGESILLRLADELKDLAIVESRPNLDGRNMVMMLAPVKNPPPPGSDDRRRVRGRRRGARGARRRARGAGGGRRGPRPGGGHRLLARAAPPSRGAPDSSSLLRRSRTRRGNLRMPKMKSRRAATKRFRVTGSGKIMFQRAGLRHNLENTSGKEQRHLSKEVTLAPEMVPGVKRMLGKR